MLADFGIPDWILIYVIAGEIGFLTAGLLLGLIGLLETAAFGINSDDVQIHRIQTAGAVGGAIGGILSVTVIGPIAQILWRTAFDANMVEVIWPFPTSLWYSAWMPSAVISGVTVGWIAALVAKRKPAKN